MSNNDIAAAGPWHKHREKDDTYSIRTQPDAEYRHGQMVGLGYGIGNAQVLEASQELLASLEDMVRYDDLPEAEKQPAVERARAAIAKARGRAAA